MSCNNQYFIKIVRRKKMEKIRTLIMGAAGRDFHNFNVFLPWKSCL